MTDIFKSQEFAAIFKYYAGMKAQRSGVPKIVHIIEGVMLLQCWDQPETTQKAFCLHPIAQDTGCSELFDDFEASMYSLEYAEIADKYLCKPETDVLTNEQDTTLLQEHLGGIPNTVAWMLLADKVQNQSDFRKYHWFKHERAIQLERYFNLWIKTLIEHYI